MIIDEYKGFESVKNAESIMPSDDIVKKMTEKYGFEKIQFTKRRGNNNVHLYYGIFQEDIDTESLKKDMDEFGYFAGQEIPMLWPENPDEKDENGNPVEQMKFTRIQFEPKESVECTDAIKETVDKIYHWTPSKNIESMEVSGIIPKSINNKFNYPPRVYLLAEQGDNYLKKVCKTFYEACKTDEDADYSCIAVDVKRLPDDIKLYWDSNLELSVYANKAIPWEICNVVNEVCFKNDGPVEVEEIETENEE